MVEIIVDDKIDVEEDDKEIKKVDLWEGDDLENMVAGQPYDGIKKGCDELKYDNDKVKCYGYNDNRRECVEKLETCLS